MHGLSRSVRAKGRVKDAILAAHALACMTGVACKTTAIHVGILVDIRRLVRNFPTGGDERYCDARQDVAASGTAK